MAERQLAATQQARAATDAYIRAVAGKSPAERIADAKTLFDAGAIDQAELDRLKAKALAQATRLRLIPRPLPRVP